MCPPFTWPARPYSRAFTGWGKLHGRRWRASRVPARAEIPRERAAFEPLQRRRPPRHRRSPSKTRCESDTTVGLWPRAGNSCMNARPRTKPTATRLVARLEPPAISMGSRRPRFVGSSNGIRTGPAHGNVSSRRPQAGIAAAAPRTRAGSGRRRDRDGAGVDPPAAHAPADLPHTEHTRRRLRVRTVTTAHSRANTQPIIDAGQKVEHPVGVWLSHGLRIPSQPAPEAGGASATRCKPGRVQRSQSAPPLPANRGADTQ